MERDKTQDINILSEPPTSIENSTEFAYLTYLSLPESTVLAYLELPLRRARQVKPKEIDSPNCLTYYSFASL